MIYGHQIEVVGPTGHVMVCRLDELDRYARVGYVPTCMPDDPEDEPGEVPEEAFYDGLSADVSR